MEKKTDFRTGMHKARSNWNEQKTIVQAIETSENRQEHFLFASICNK